MKKGTQSRRRRQPIILSQQLYLSTFISPRGAHHTLDAVGPTKGKVAGAEQRPERGPERRRENIKKVQKVKDAFSSFLLFTRTNKQLKVMATPII